MFLTFNRRIKQGVRMDEISETHSRRPYVFAHFNVAYFGICVPHAWIYCIIHRADMDFGGFPITVPLYIALSLFMLAFLLVARASGTPRLGSKLDWPLAALQALATIPLVVAVPLDGPAMLYAAIALPSGRSVAQSPSAAHARIKRARRKSHDTEPERKGSVRARGSDHEAHRKQRAEALPT